MVAAYIVDDRLVHLVATDPDGAGIDNAAERQHRHLRRAAADIDDHGARRLRHRQAGADSRGHRLLDQVDPPRACAQGAFLDRAALHLGRTGGDAHHHLRRNEAAPVVHPANKILDHLLGDFEVGDDAVAQRANGFDITRGAAEHQLGFLANRQHLLAAAMLPHGDDGGLVQHDAAAGHIDQRVGRAEVDSQILAEKAENGGEHGASQYLCAQNGCSAAMYSRAAHLTQSGTLSRAGFSSWLYPQGRFRRSTASCRADGRQPPPVGARRPGGASP